ncbi:phosphatase PAP2 family protein [Streptomyces sp. H39-C1]|uniref:phosphatase PAP2 family protein n=1 Tax=Streptomyces sp. H39-C1 TaxID=3004355 RepID=UPI0022AF0836|nr:phosphatase PAP2 family protein [Streptomyces sp. H39-C1]MCZ4103695.1 phosphatase PAP2 family protein [Streptomyces sp. H39-C1]
MTATSFQALDGAAIDGGWYTTVTDFARDTHWLNAPMLAFTSYGAALFVLALLAGWWMARRADAAAMAASLAGGVAVILAYLLNSGIKDVFAEPRPCRALPHDFLVEACPPLNDYAFPSNHTTVAFAAATALLLIHRRLGALALVLAVLMAASRVYVGAHYPHDVIIAALVGTAIAVPTVLLGRRYGAPTVERLRTSRLRPVLARR